MLKHSNFKISFGPLRWILASPTYHHWHHANQPEAYDRNFAGQLPLIDLLFGTAIMKEAEGPSAYGVDEPIPEDFVGQLIVPFRKADMADASSAQPLADAG
jgi:sterol desaturase/sphingolipid hydroxylase (fatty acid hydroxylase superfamily)